MTGPGTGFLYPFIDGDERDGAGLLDDLAGSAAAKQADSHRLRAATLQACSGEIGRAADALVRRFGAGGRLFAFGNGGSATDADAFVSLFARPPRGRALPARSFLADQAVVSALGNDVGFDLVFSRQVIAYGSAQDVAAAFSTSGSSANVLRGLAEARRRGLLTLGWTGYGGGDMATSGVVDHLFVVESSSVHRIQETQDAVATALWVEVQRRMADE
ncbi:MAG: SIS domain-containing protein [Acidimicrobiales bacterium]